MARPQTHRWLLLPLAAGLWLGACSRDDKRPEKTSEAQPSPPGGEDAGADRAVDPFTRVYVDGPLDVHVAVRGGTEVSISGPDRLVAKVTTTVKANTLKLALAEPLDTPEAIRVEVATPSLDGVAMSARGVTVVEGIEGGSFEAANSGEGRLVLRGAADALSVSLSGKGRVEAFKLAAVEVEVTLNGAGQAEVSASKSLTATTTGTGDVVYRGQPEVTATTLGSGKVRPEG